MTREEWKAYGTGDEEDGMSYQMKSVMCGGGRMAMYDGPHSSQINKPEGVFPWHCGFLQKDRMRRVVSIENTAPL